MTNEEIVKALRCMSTEGNVAPDCKGCPFYAREQLDPETAEKLGIIGEGEWFSCDCNAVGFAAADLIENQQNHIRALLQANDALRQRWAPVAERLPKPETRVLVLDRYGHMMDRTMRQLPTDKTPLFRPDGLMPGKDVTHWMPLPPTPEVGHDQD